MSGVRCQMSEVRLSVLCTLFSVLCSLFSVLCFFSIRSLCGWIRDGCIGPLPQAKPSSGTARTRRSSMNQIKTSISAADIAAGGCYNSSSVKNITESPSNLLPLSRDGEGELAVPISFDRGRAVVAQVVKVVAKLEVGLHYLLPGDHLAGMTGGAAH